MNRTSNKWIVLSIVIAALAIAGLGYFAFTKYYQPKVEAKKKVMEETIRKDAFSHRFDEYSNMISVGLCQEAYNEFISEGSKTRKGQGFFDHCKYRKEKWNNFNTSTTVFSPDYKRADVKLAYDLSMPDLDSLKYKECLDNNSVNGWPSLSSWRFCESIAPTKIEKRDTLETWLFENNKWMRDY